MPSLKLTKSAVDSARPGTTDHELRDTIIPGFFCKITPAGRKVFMLSYRTPSWRAAQAVARHLRPDHR